MPDETYTGLWAALGSAITAGSGVTVALLRRPSGDSSAARAVSLDRTQQAIIDGLRQELREAKDDARLWERRARRIDEIAHVLWHPFVNLVQQGLARLPAGLTRLPFLEDPL